MTSAGPYIKEYASIVLNREWRNLAETGRLDFGARSPRQTALNDFMLDQVGEISDLRLNREAAALIGVSNFFCWRPSPAS